MDCSMRLLFIALPLHSREQLFRAWAELYSQRVCAQDEISATTEVCKI
jgi:hypothetical protein